MINEYDINLIKELKEYIREYNIRYFRKEKDWFKNKYPLPTIGFEIKNNGAMPGKTLLNLSKRLTITDAIELSFLKKMNRKRLKSLLGDKPLKSKELFFMK